MDCGKYQEGLSAAALGAECGAEVQALRLHLEICEACRGELARRGEFLGAQDQKLQAQFEAAPSPDFNSRLRRRIAEDATRGTWASSRWIPVFAGAAALAMVVAFFHFHHQGAVQPRDSNVVPNATAEVRPSLSASSAGNSPAPSQKNMAAALTPPQRLSLHSVVAGRPPAPALEVRIDRRELYATVLFAQAVADGRINAEPLLEAQREPDKPIAANPLEIPLLDINPIEKPNTESDLTER